MIDKQVVEICKVLEDNKAQDILVINISKISSICDNVILATGTSSTHVKALSNFINEDVKIPSLCKEGFGESNWVVVDYGDIIVHIFTKDIRDYYNLEKLYSDGKTKKFDSIKKDIKEEEKKEQRKQKDQEKKEKEQQRKTAKKEAKSKKAEPKEKPLKTTKGKAKQKDPIEE